MAEIRATDIDSGTLGVSFQEQSGHATLGAEFQIGRESAAGLEVGTRIFVKNENDELKKDPTYDYVGVILGHHEGKLQLLTIRPKANNPWQRRGDDFASSRSIEGALTAIDRLFDPETEFGSVAVLSRLTSFNGAGTKAGNTVGEAGCNSHEKTNLSTTLAVSQLMEPYEVRPILLDPESQLIRRFEGDSEIVKLSPGETIEGQPDREERDKLAVVDRIGVLVTGNGAESPFLGMRPVAVLRGIVEVAGSGKLDDQERPISDLQRSLVASAERLVG